MTRPFNIDAYEPITGSYHTPDEPLNDAYLAVRDTLEVYAELFGRWAGTTITVDEASGSPVITRMTVDQGPLSGAVEQRNSHATILDYRLDFDPSKDATFAEYTFLKNLLDPRAEPDEGSLDPRDLIEDAGIVLAEDDLTHMLRKGDIEDADRYGREYAEGHAETGQAILREQLGDDVFEQYLAEDPELQDDIIERYRVAHAAQDSGFSEDIPTLADDTPIKAFQEVAAEYESLRDMLDAANPVEWAFRPVLTDRTREGDTVRYTVELESDLVAGDDAPFADGADPVGSFTFTLHHARERLRQTGKRLQDGA